MNILGVIPARGGSKGIPRKNILDFCGKPLITYSIELGNRAVEQGLLRSCIVSTDDREIADISRAAGARTPFLRPAELATSTAKTVDVLLHALAFLEERGESYDAVMLLQPVCPLRTIGDVEQVIRLAETTGAESVISVYKEEYVCDLVSYRMEGRFGAPLDPDHNKGRRRQEHQALYIRNGSFYLTRTSFLKDTGLIISDRPALFVMDKQRSNNLDTPEDVELLEWALSR